MMNARKGYQLPKPVTAAVAAGTNVIKVLHEFIGYSVEDLSLTSGLTTGEIFCYRGGP